MLRRRLACLSFLLLLPAAACEKPPAGEPTTVPGETESAADAEGGGDAATDNADNADNADADNANNANADNANADNADDEALPAAKEVLASAIEAVGGRAAIDAIVSSYVESKTEIQSQNMSIETRIWSKGGNFYVESDMPGMGKSKIWKKGDEIWSQDPINGMRKLEGKEAAQARWSADPMLAANWNTYFDEAKTIGRSTQGKQQLIEVELSKGDEKLVLLFDAKSHLPAGQSFMQETPMGEMPIRVTLEDYREIEGVMTSFRSVTDMQLMSAVQTTSKYEVNVEIDDAKFEPPKK